jgi:peptidoglycan/xylan/chitin deacetylase (PgdA/CDA1 family)
MSPSAPPASYVTALADGALAIFLFHGVILRARAGVRNYTSKHITRERFAAVLDALSAAGEPVSMPEVVTAWTAGKSLPPRAFAVTFDDGFENNYSVAAPVLERSGVPATFYVTTGFVDANGCSWIDLIEAAVEARDHVELTLPFPPRHARYGSVAEKRDLLDAIRGYVKGNPALDPYEFAADVCRQLGVTAADPDGELDRKLTWNQVRELHHHPLFTIGGHGHTHRILEYLSPAALRDEIDGSVDRLTTHLGAPTEHYSYPEGLAHCYSDRVIRELRRSGVGCAPTAEPGTNRPGDDLFRLKRLMVV